jgi:hypothetical protein
MDVIEDCGLVKTDRNPRGVRKQFIPGILKCI